SPLTQLRKCILHEDHEEESGLKFLEPAIRVVHKHTFPRKDQFQQMFLQHQKSSLLQHHEPHVQTVPCSVSFQNTNGQLLSQKSLVPHEHHGSVPCRQCTYTSQPSSLGLP